MPSILLLGQWETEAQWFQITATNKWPREEAHVQCDATSSFCLGVMAFRAYSKEISSNTSRASLNLQFRLRRDGPRPLDGGHGWHTGKCSSSLPRGQRQQEMCREGLDGDSDAEPRGKSGVRTLCGQQSRNECPSTSRGTPGTHKHSNRNGPVCTPYRVERKSQHSVGTDGGRGTLLAEGGTGHCLQGISSEVHRALYLPTCSPIPGEFINGITYIHAHTHK